MSTQLEIASRILAGLVVNQSIIQPNELSGWSIVNCSPRGLAELAFELAGELIDLDHVKERP